MKRPGRKPCSEVCRPWSAGREALLLREAGLLCWAVWLAGCGTPGWIKTPEWLTTPAWISSQSPDDDKVEDNPSSKVKLVGDVAAPFGREQQSVEGIGLVVGLPGTGSDPPASIYRTKLLDEMKKRGVEKPEALLASPNTAIVLVRGYLRPGMQEEEMFDVEVRVPDRNDTSSLRGGYLMPTELRETIVVQGELHHGRPEAVAKGPIMVDPGADSEGAAAAKQGRVLGGAEVKKSHTLSLILKPGFQQLKYTAWVDHAIDRRFQYRAKGHKEEVSKLADKNVIQLKLAARYKDNVQRYLRVVQALPLKETPGQRVDRLVQLERQLLDPATSATAALRLEALGAEGADVLIKGLQNQHAEVRFYAAEALAYLGHEKSSLAAVPLGAAARNEPAFRVHALSALSALSQYEATEQLHQLLGAESAETRYGAFRALWAANHKDPLVQGEMLGNEQGRFGFHVLAIDGPRMIHVTRSYRAEVVLFGQDISLAQPFLLEAGRHIRVHGPPEGPITVSFAAPDAPTQSRQVTPRIEEVIRTVAELGGTYPDVVQMLQQAVAAGALPGCRLEIDAVPQPGRAYTRPKTEGGSESPSPAASPLPTLFSAGGAPRERAPADVEAPAEATPEPNESGKPWRKLWPW